MVITTSKNLKSKSLTIENNLKKLFESINYDFIEYAFKSEIESPNVYHFKKDELGKYYYNERTISGSITDKRIFLDLISGEIIVLDKYDSEFVFSVDVDKIVDFGFTPVTIDYFIEFLKLIKNYDLSRLNKAQINIMLLDYYCEEKWKVINILLKTILNATNCMLRVYDTNEKINTDKVKLNFSVNLDSNQTESPNPDDVEIKRLNQLSFVDRVEIFKDENRIVIYPKNRNINSVVVNNIALTK